MGHSNGRLKSLCGSKLRHWPAPKPIFLRKWGRIPPNNRTPDRKQLWRRNHHFFPMGHKEEKEAKKEAFRKYLESNGVVDALTTVLVALYEQNDKPSSALEFIQQRLGGPSLAEYEKLQSEMADLQVKYDELLATHKETCKELEELKNSHNMVVTSTKDTTDGENENEKP